MRRPLTIHPDSLCEAASSIDVAVCRPRRGSLVLHYCVTGAIADLRMPPVTSAARADGLWQSTCFEAFVRSPADAAYYEFNFAPSTQWAAYRFKRYRTGMRAVSEMSAPRIELKASPDLFTLRASLELDRLSGLPGDAIWHLGLSALIEETSGRKSYWALAHPAGKPDFHHSDCLVLELP